MANKERLIVRTDEKSLDKWGRRAKSEGKTISEWVRGVLDAAVSPPAVQVAIRTSTAPATLFPAEPGRKLTAQELAARIGGGLSVGMPSAIPVDEGPWWDTGEDAAEPEAETDEARCRRMYPTQVAQASARSKQFKGKDAWGRMDWLERYEHIRSALESGDTGAA